MKRIVSVCAALLLAAFSGLAQDWGGHYTMDIPDQARGDLYLVPVGPAEAEFLLVVGRPDGSQIVFDSNGTPVRLDGNSFVWRYPSPEIDYSISFDLNPMSDEDIPVEGCILVTESLISATPPYNIGLSPNGLYSRDDKCFVTPDGYMYRINEAGNACMLACGGLYSEIVSLPQSVKGPFGRMFLVKGLESDAFRFSQGVTKVETYDDQQIISPGALMYTDIPYDFSVSPLPFFAYPDKSLTRFVIPYFPELNTPDDDFQWVVFKHNLAPAMKSGDTTGDNRKRDGRVDVAFDSTRGVFYTIQSAREDISKMFRGYTAMEIEGLVADKWYVAHHTFPAFGRWKFPEKEVAASKGIENAMSRKTGRAVKYSRKAAWLRDGTGELDIVEYEHVNRQAMVSFVWQSKGKVVATASLTTQIESEYEDYSVWNVDDDGRYGIPDVVSIAQDKDGAVTIYIAKNAPESVTCFALHQEGNSLRIVPFDQWYRFVDI
ncbi:MAG: hypothetical protein J5737_02250 [Bacteroidales bacterium]|nr:hypothetical protein [Bacteroidales bacterium]